MNGWVAGGIIVAACTCIGIAYAYGCLIEEAEKNIGRELTFLETILFAQNPLIGLWLFEEAKERRKAKRRTKTKG